MDGVQLFKRLATSLRAEFDLARGVPHHGEAGRAGEHLVRDFLRKHLPQRLVATDGFVFSRSGGISGQCDLLIAEALNCAPLVWSPGVSAYPIDGVLARIEVTQTLTRAKLREDCARLVSFGQMEPVQPRAREHQQEFAPTRLIFARHADTSLRTLVSWVAGAYADLSEAERSFFPNAVLVLNLGLVFALEDRGSGIKFNWSMTRANRLAWAENHETVLALWLHMLLRDIRAKLRFRAELAAATTCADALERGETWATSLTSEQQTAVTKVVAGNDYLLSPLEYFTGEQYAEAVLPIESVPFEVAASRWRD